MRNVILAAIFCVVSGAVQAQPAPTDIPPVQYGNLGDFKLENGQAIRDCKLGYRTLGTMNATKSNVVLFPSWFAGRSDGVAMNVGPGKLVDTSKYFVVAIDALGDGLSCSPSNSTTQHGPNFPQFSIRDMVHSEYLLATETLHLQHVHAVVGLSMGAIQTFQWMVSYPEFMDAAVPIEGTPQLSSYDLMFLNMEKKALLDDPEYKGGKYDRTPTLPMVALLHNLNLSTPQFHVDHTTREGFQQYFDNLVTNGQHYFDANDYLWQMQAILGHDIAHGGSLYDAAAKVKTRVLIIVATQDHMVNPIPALGFAKLIHAQTLQLESDCGHMSAGCEIAKVSPVVDRFLSAQ